MLADNIIYLRKHNPDLYQELSQLNDVSKEVLIEMARSGQNTLRVMNQGKSNYLHSKYDPQKEAEAVIEKFTVREEITVDSHIVFYGAGLGYHIDSFVNKYPEVDFSIFEPSIEVINYFLNEKSLSKYSSQAFKGITCEAVEVNIQTFFNKTLQTSSKRTIICVLPSYENVFNDNYQAFLKAIKDFTKIKRSSIHTNLAFKQRWILNSVINFENVLKTPNVLLESKNDFSDKTAILVAAGPSLDLELENLKRIKTEKMAYIFSVGSSINTLVENDIIPDAMCTYDPQGTNQNVFEKVYSSEITSIPMIFGTSVGCETVQRYNGPKCHMITSQDTISRYFLKPIDHNELIMVNDAPSIAVMTLELLQKMNFKEIILVGQNLAYKNKVYYAGGIDYGTQVNANDNTHLIEVDDVLGNKIHTNESLNRMRFDLEMRITQAPVPVINTTVDGAAIKGTTFRRLEDLILENLTSAYDISAFEKMNKTEYDFNYIKDRFKNVKLSYERYKMLLVKIKELILKTDILITNQNLKQGESMYQKIDRLVLELESNDYVKVFVIPMFRVEYELLVANLQRVRSENKSLKKLKGQIIYLDAFINQLSNDYDTESKIIIILEKIITDYEAELSKDSGVEV